MEIDETGIVVSRSIGPAVIRVKRRCNYKEIRKALEDGIIPDDLQPFMPMIEDLRDLSKILKDMRWISSFRNLRLFSMKKALLYGWKSGNVP